MYGFIGTFSPTTPLDVRLSCESHGNATLIENNYTDKYLTIKRRTPNKFVDDKIFYNSDRYVIVIEGVIYNYNELFQLCDASSRGELFEKMLKKMPVENLCDKIRGLFSGLIYDKLNKEVLLITDHVTYKPIWYYIYNEIIFFSTDIDWLYRTLLENNIKIELDYDGAYSLLNYGFMIGDTTVAKGIKKILPGHIIKFDKKGKNDVEYYILEPPVRKSASYSTAEYDELLSEINRLFEKSIRNAYEKDKEYGYKHCATFSGGLDSRMVVLTAKKLGYDTMCLTMGESNCKDIEIASKICDDYALEHMIYELNNGLYLLDFDSAIVGNGATILAPGYLHSYRLKSLINLESYGAIHSGDVGDAILGGSLLKYGSSERIDLASGMYGSVFMDGFSDEFKNREKTRYENQYIFHFYNRGLNSAGNGCIATQCFTEIGSPFLDKDLLSLLMSIPYDMLNEHRLYFDYINRYLPEAKKYVWTGNGCRPGASQIDILMKKCHSIIDHRLLKRNETMNPYDKWYLTNSSISKMFNQIYTEGEMLIGHNKKIWNDITVRFESKRTMDKALACTLIRFIYLYNVIVEE